MTLVVDQPRILLPTEQLPIIPTLEAKERDIEATVHAIGSMVVTVEGKKYLMAGTDRYRSSFTRDSITTLTLMGDVALLESQIDYSGLNIGEVKDPSTGEEPGKAHHELPSVTIEGKSTAYNACDTTAMLLLGISALTESGDTGIIDKYAETIQAGVSYIKDHVNTSGLFIEDPVFAGATERDGRERKFGLKVSYWKDSELNRPGRREPNYPIVYSLAHFQNAEALQKIGNVLGDERLARYGRYMTEAGIDYLWKDDHFVTAIDGDGVVDGPSTDSLFALLYISPDLLGEGYAQKIEDYSKQLETKRGYRSGIPVVPDVDPYHMMVWTHEQALLNAAARKHNLVRAEAVTRQIVQSIIPSADIFPEIINPDTLQPEGNIKQLWAMGAYLYFQNPERALL